MSALGKTLKYELVSRGIQRREFCRALGIPESTFSYIIQGKGDPRTSTLLKIADALNVPCDYLLGRVGKNENGGYIEKPLKHETKEHTIEWIDGAREELMSPRPSITYALLLLNEALNELEA